MALMLLLSTVSWTIDKHLCMGRVMDIAFFAKAQDCGMDAAMALLEDEALENHCCDDESFTIQGQEDLELTLSKDSLNNQFFLVAFAVSSLHLENDIQKKALSNEYYPPPILIKDIQLFNEVFLI